MYDSIELFVQSLHYISIIRLQRPETLILALYTRCYVWGRISVFTVKYNSYTHTLENLYLLVQCLIEKLKTKQTVASSKAACNRCYNYRALYTGPCTVKLRVNIITSISVNPPNGFVLRLRVGLSCKHV